MSISALEFANHQKYKDKYNEEYEGGIYYFSTGDGIAQIGDGIEFSCGLTDGDPADITLFEYSDGKKIVMSYTLEKTDLPPDSFTYHLTCSARMDDKNGNNIIPALQSMDFYESFSLSQPGFETVPFSVMHYVPSIVDYQSPSTPAGGSTGPGQPAEVLYLWGGIYWKKPRVPLGGYISLYGTNNVNDLNNSYGGARFSMIVTDDTGYNDYYHLVDPDDKWHEPGVVPPKPDPSEPGGGDRPSEDGGDPVDFPGLPSVGVINTGFITLYNPDNTQLRSLAGVLWSNDFETSIKKILNDPFDGLIGLTLLPFAPTTSGAINCKIGNFDTQVSMALVSRQYYTLDCGSITVTENWKNALDYNATTIEIFVPFVGFRTLNIQDCMGRVIHLKYNIDILTGSGVAILKCGDKCLYEWPCNVSYNIPLTGSNKAALYTGLINIALSGAGGLAAGGPMGAVGGAATSAINVATHAQSNVQRSGAISSNTGVLGEFIPYIVIHRPKQSLPQNFRNYKGYQSNITSSLSSCKGYTEVEYVHLTNITGATDTELNEIETLLKNGVII